MTAKPERRFPPHAATARLFVQLGALNAFLAVGLGAFGAHGLRGRLSESLLTIYHTGVDYHVTHALGLVAIGLTAGLRLARPGALATAGWLFVVGIILFSGSLYVLAISGNRALGMITPFGGVAFLAGWIALAAGVVLRPGKVDPGSNH